jgi:hypothetical protein
MDNAIYEYIKNGITINGNPIDGYEVFTIPTQHFHIDSLHQLTPQVFEEMIEEQKEKEWFHSRLLEALKPEVQKEIDQEILNQLRGGEPNPDIIPMNTTDRLFKQFMETSKGDPDLIWNKEQFVNMLLTDDDFYQKWGEDCCEELTYEERYKLWFSNNYETGMEYNPVYTPPTEPDWDNEYYEPTPKRKLKWN